MRILTCLGIVLATGSLFAAALARPPELREGPQPRLTPQGEKALTGADENVSRPSLTIPKLREGPAIDSPSVFIRSIVVRGAKAVSPADLNVAVRNFENKRLNGADLQRLANVLSRVYRDRGFILSKAVIEPQEFENQTLIVSMSEGFLTKVIVNEQASHHLNKYFEKALSEQPVREKTLARAMSLSRSEPGYRIIDQRIENDPDQNDGYYVFLTVERAPVQARLSVTNKGVRRGEQWRALLSTKFNSVLRSGDQASVDLLTKPTAAAELQYLRMGYSAPIGRSGLTVFLGGALSDTSPKSALASRNLSGAMRSGAIGIAYPIIKSNRQQLVSLAKFDAINESESEDSVRLYNDRLRVLRLSSTYQLATPNWRFGGTAQLSQGFDAFNASDRSGVLTSRPDADAQFLKLDGEINVRRQFGERISLSAGLIGQYATSPLLYNEEFSIGGGQYGRGYDFGEILGDVGAAAYIEAGIRGGSWGVLDRWEAYSFVDVGAVWNKGTGLSVDGNPLYSAGGGLRLGVNDDLSIGYEVAQPLSDAPYTEDDRSARHRLQFTVSYN